MSRFSRRIGRMDNDTIMIDAGSAATDHKMQGVIRLNHRLVCPPPLNTLPSGRMAPLPPCSSALIAQHPKSILRKSTAQSWNSYNDLNPGHRRFHPYAKAMRKQMRMAQGKESSNVPVTSNEKEYIQQLQRAKRKRASAESEERESKRPCAANGQNHRMAVLRDPIPTTAQAPVAVQASAEGQDPPAPVMETTIVPDNTILTRGSADARFRQVTGFLKDARRALQQGIRTSIEFAANVGRRFAISEETSQIPANNEVSQETTTDITDDDILAASAQLQAELTAHVAVLPSPITLMLSQGDPSASQLRVELVDYTSHAHPPSIIAEPHMNSMTSANLMAQDRSMVNEDIMTGDNASLLVEDIPDGERILTHQNAEASASADEDPDVRAIRAAMASSRAHPSVNAASGSQSHRNRRPFPINPRRRPHMPHVSASWIGDDCAHSHHIVPEAMLSVHEKEEQRQEMSSLDKQEQPRGDEQEGARNVRPAGDDENAVVAGIAIQSTEAPTEVVPEAEDEWDEGVYRPGEPPLLPSFRGRNIQPMVPHEAETEREIEAEVQEAVDQLAATTVADEEHETPEPEDDGVIRRSVTWLETDTPMGRPISAVRLFHVVSPPMTLKDRTAPLNQAEWEAIEAENRRREEQERQEERKRFLQEIEDSLGRVRIPDGESAVRPLSDEWKRRLQTAMSGPAQRTLVTSLEGAELTKQKMLTCYTPMAWLNDEVVNGHLALTVDYLRGLANNRGGRNVKPKYYAFNSFFYSKLREGGYAAVSRWTRRAKIQGKALLDVEIVFIPVHQHSHWTLLVVSPKHRIIEYFDSLGSGAGAFVKNIKEWLKGELEDAYDEEEWYVLNTPSPQQDNGSDCGVFLLTTAKAVALGLEPTVYGPADIPLIRKKIVAELINGALEGDFNPAGENGEKRL